MKYLAVILIIIIQICISCSSSKKHVDDQQKKTEAIDESKQARNVFSKKSDQTYFGLKVSKDSVRSLFSSHKDILSGWTFRIPGSLQPHHIEKNGRWILDQTSFILSLSILAKEGDQEIEEYMLDEFEKLFQEILHDRESNISKDDLSYNSYFASELLKSHWHEFNRLPPSPRKVKLIYGLIGINPDCFHYYDFYLNGDVSMVKALLSNYKGKEADRFKNMRRETGRATFKIRSQRAKISGQGTTCSFYENYLPDFVEEVKEAYNSGSLEMITRDEWQDMYVENNSIY